MSTRQLSESDLCRLRPRWDRYVTRLVSSESEGAVHDCITRALSKGYTRSKLADRLERYVGSGRDADKLAERVFLVVQDYRTENDRRKRRRSVSRSASPSGHHRQQKVCSDLSQHREGSKRPNLEGENEEWKEKRVRTDAVSDVGARTGDSEQLTENGDEHVDIQELMINAQKQIMERQAALNFDMSEHRSKKINELQARISMQMGSLAGVLNVIEENEKPIHVTIDKEGRTIDTRTGQIVRMESRLPTLKANIRAAQRTTAEGGKGTAASSLEAVPPAKGHEPDGKTQAEVVTASKSQLKAEPAINHLDNRIFCKPAARLRRQGFNFVAKGKYQELGQRVRAKERLDRLQAEIDENVKKTKIVAESKYVLIQQSRKTLQNESIPDIEWWDTVIIHDRNYDRLTGNQEMDRKRLFGISNLVEHPSQIKPRTRNNPLDEALPVYLTRKERRKLRRQNRAEALREQQEKIRLGLIQPPEPKVRISNLMKVLGSEAVQDPSKVETYVRSQMEKRFRAHQDANEARRLTAQQRREKMRQKLIADGVAFGLRACVYRVADLGDQSTKFKVEANCKQLYMTGCVILCKELNVIVVEGGPKQQKQYKKLMLRRIKWNELAFLDKDGNEQRNKCSLVWEGVIKDRAFSDIQCKVSPSETFAREFFKQHDVEHYWNIVLSDVILECNSAN